MTQKVTIVISSDNYYTHYLGVDLKTGSEVFREKYPSDDDDEIIGLLCKKYNVKVVNRIVGFRSNSTMY